MLKEPGMKAIKLPLSFRNGALVSTTDLHQIFKQKIIDVLVTSKQERVMIPEYGADVYSLLYTMLDPMIFADFKADALLELSQGVTGVDIVDILLSSGESLTSSDESTTLSITVLYRVPPHQVTSMTFTVSEFLSEESFM